MRRTATTERVDRLLTLAGTLASALAFALYTRVEWVWLPLGFVGLVPWMMALDRAPSLGAAFGAGLLMSAAFVIAVFAWFASAIATYTGNAVATSLAALILLAPLLQPQLVTFAVARHVARRSGFWRVTVRATNTGISAIISPTGELTAVAGVHERAALVAAVRPEREATTLMLAWGDWFGPTALGVGVLLLASTLRRA